MSPKNLFIFGAGASKADNAPLNDELIKEIFSILKHNGDIQSNPSINSLQTFLFKMYPITREFQNDKDKYPTFEEILGLLQFAINRDESFKGFSQDQLREFINLIIALMALVIEKKAATSNKINKKFITELFKNFKKQHQNLELDKTMEKFAKQNYFLNINYDILLDSALYKLKNQNDNCDIDYCLEIKDPNMPSKDIKIFKPHGSLNWLICKSCGLRTIGNVLKIGMESIRATIWGRGLNNCSQCGTKMSAIIIPPTFFKELNTDPIRNILVNLENHLKEVQNLIFIGYSFPEADLHLKYVFKKAQLFEGFKKIILIDKNIENIPKESRPYFKNIIRSFPGVQLVDLTSEIPLNEGLAENSIKAIIDHLSRHIYTDHKN